MLRVFVCSTGNLAWNRIVPMRALLNHGSCAEFSGNLAWNESVPVRPARPLRGSWWNWPIPLRDLVGLLCFVTC